MAFVTSVVTSRITLGLAVATAIGGGAFAVGGVSLGALIAKVASVVTGILTIAQVSVLRNFLKDKITLSLATATAIGGVAAASKMGMPLGLVIAKVAACAMAVSLFARFIGYMVSPVEARVTSTNRSSAASSFIRTDDVVMSGGGGGSASVAQSPALGAGSAAPGSLLAPSSSLTNTLVPGAGDSVLPLPPKDCVSAEQNAADDLSGTKNLFRSPTKPLVSGGSKAGEPVASAPAAPSASHESTSAVSEPSNRSAAATIAHSSSSSSGEPASQSREHYTGFTPQLMDMFSNLKEPDNSLNPSVSGDSSASEPVGSAAKPKGSAPAPAAPSAPHESASAVSESLDVSAVPTMDHLLVASYQGSSTQDYFAAFVLAQTASTTTSAVSSGSSLPASPAPAAPSPVLKPLDVSAATTSADSSSSSSDVLALRQPFTPESLLAVSKMSLAELHSSPLSSPNDIMNAVETALKNTSFATVEQLQKVGLSLTADSFPVKETVLPSASSSTSATQSSSSSAASSASTAATTSSSSSSASTVSVGSMTHQSTFSSTVSATVVAPASPTIVTLEQRPHALDSPETTVASPTPSKTDSVSSNKNGKKRGKGRRKK